jgi:ankyrin repeat protein
MSDDYSYYLDILANGSIEQLEELSELDDEFPGGKDDLVFTYWIINAIAHGSKLSIKWMLNKGVNLNFLGDDGYTVLHSAIERLAEDKYDILELLLNKGAPINIQGINDWTPAHMAAAREDIRALELLVKYGADLSIKTRIDNFATPLEEAKLLKCQESVKYLESIT